MSIYFRLAPIAFALTILAGGVAARAEEPPPGKQFLMFIQSQAAELRAGHANAPGSQDAWEKSKAEIRERLLAAWGGFPEQPCPLNVKKLGELDRDGYRIEQLILQTRPGIWMTAHAYVPKGEGKLPAVLNVHGHWREAKQAPQVQARCLGLVKLGFFVLAVDAFGAGERAVGEALGEYHGELTAATLWPVGLPLSGLQVYDNMRAVDYLQSRPEVDPERIGLTGASGGGNQSMYAGAWDERFKAVVPVCSVGTYESYLGAACCMCEVVPGALRFMGEGDVLGLVAPRGLMVISATKDAFQFSVGEARKSLAYAGPVFGHYRLPTQAQHVVIESPHDFNREMREAMYGWMTLQLKGEGNGEPIPDPEFQTEDPESLRCYPGDTRPDDWITLPQFAAAEARRVLAKRPHKVAGSAEWSEIRGAMLDGLKSGPLAGSPELACPLNLEEAFAGDDKPITLTFDSEPGVTINAEIHAPREATGRVAVLALLDAGDRELVDSLRNACLAAGWQVVLPELRATGSTAYPGDVVFNCPDHNTAEWAMWIGRPMLGQWTHDLRRTLDALAADGTEAQNVTLIGVGTAGPVALCAAAVDERFDRVATVNSLATYVCDVPYRKQRLGILAPSILRDVGDVSHLAALAAPRRLVIAGGLHGSGRSLNGDALMENFEFTRQVYNAMEAKPSLQILESAEAEAIVQALK